MCALRALVRTLSLCLLIAGCSSYKSDLAKARQLEEKGKYPQALAIYDRSIVKIPQEQSGEQANAYVHLGNCLYQTERINEAFVSYQKALELDPQNADANLHVAELMVAAGMAQQALPYITVVARAQPTNPAALAVLGAVHASLGNYDDATALYRRALALDPTRVNVSLALAELYNRNEKVDDARAVLMKAAERNPKSALPWLGLGRLEEQEGNAAAAERDYRSAVSANDDPQTNLRLAQFLQRTAQVVQAERVLARIDKLSVGASTSLGDFQLSSGQSFSALQQYLTALESQEMPAGARAKAHDDSGDVASLTARAVEAELARPRDMQVPNAARRLLSAHRAEIDPGTLATLEAEIALTEGNLAVAESQAMLAVEKAPDSAAAHYVLGEVRQRQAKTAEAKSEFTAAFAADSSHVPSRLALAEMELKEGANLAAEEHASGVVREEPANLRALTVYARVLMQQGRYASAQSIANRAAAVDKQAVAPRTVLGDIALRQGKLSSALLAYEQAVLLDPQSSEALQGLVQVYRRGRFDRAMLRRMEKVAGAPPASAALMEIAGRLYADHGWTQDAVRALRRAAQLDSLRSSATLALSEAYSNQKQYDAAYEVASRAFSGPEVQPNTLALMTALRAEQNQDLDSAIRNYESALKSGDPRGVAANNLAWLYASRGKKLDRALELAELAHERDPQNAAIQDTLGVVHLKRRNFTDAVSVLQDGIRLAERQRRNANARSTERDLYLHLAEAFSGIGDDHAASTARAKAAAL